MEKLLITHNMSRKIISNLNPLSANATKWSNTLKQFVSKLPTNCLSVFDLFVRFALKGLIRHDQINFLGVRTKIIKKCMWMWININFQ